MSWQDEMIPMVRNIVNDADPSNYTYSDARVQSLIVTAARVSILEINYAYPYAVSIQAGTIFPDPTNVSPGQVPSVYDDIFIGLVSLKAACLVDQSTYRTKMLAAGIRATLGPASINTDGMLNGFLKLLEQGACAMYEELSTQIQFGSPPVQAILSPFVNNKFDPRIFAGWSYRESGTGLWSGGGGQDSFLG